MLCEFKQEGVSQRYFFVHQTNSQGAGEVFVEIDLVEAEAWAEPGAEALADRIVFPSFFLP